MLEVAAVTFGALFPIIDPVGGLPVFYGLTANMTDDRRRTEARKAGLAMFGLLVGFLFFGRFVLDFFGVTLAALETAGGLVVGRSGWLMISKGLEDEDAADATASVWMTPMAMPLLAGPGALGVVLGLAARHETGVNNVGHVLGIAGITLLTFLLLRHGHRVMRLLGRDGTDALIRVLGLIVLAIALELVYHGVQMATGFHGMAAAAG